MHVIIVPLYYCTSCYNS